MIFSSCEDLVRLWYGAHEEETGIGAGSFKRGVSSARLRDAVAAASAAQARTTMGSGTTVGTGRFPVTTVMMQEAGGIFSVLFVRSVVKIPACAAEARRFGVAKARERLPCALCSPW